MGQSESSVQIENDSGVLKIVKRSPSRNARFHNQYVKHKAAETSMMEPILVPKVLSDFREFSYEMEYVHGVPFGNFISICDQQELREPLEKISDYFNRSLTNSERMRTEELKLAFKEKLRILKIRFLSEKKDNSLFSRLLEYLESAVEEIEIPSGWNHGDFSFENVLVGQYSHQVFAVDFLDSPFESPLIDIGRMWLDSRFGWWGAGLHANSCYQLNSKVLSGAILETVLPHSITVFELNIFAALAILRIRPYTLNPLRMAFLKNSALQILGGKQ
jgi:Phosphotransferase enzyme family